MAAALLGALGGMGVGAALLALMALLEGAGGGAALWNGLAVPLCQCLAALLGMGLAGALSRDEIWLVPVLTGVFFFLFSWAMGIILGGVGFSERAWVFLGMIAICSALKILWMRKKRGTS